MPAAELRAPIPKAELHLHIEGTLEPELALEIAARNRLSLPCADAAELRRRYRFHNLQSFLDVYYATMSVLRTEQDFADLATGYLERARSQGVRHAEIFFDPQAHSERGVGMPTVVEGLWSALEGSERRYGISTALIACFLRDRGVEAAMEALLAALPFRERITGVGLDSAEVGHPPSTFVDVFGRARAEGFRCVAHAGEEGPASYIWEALDLLKVARVDHGIRCLDDPALVARLRDQQIPLTVCPLSNVRLHAVGSLEQHPLRRLLDAGVLATINSDDPAYFGGYVAENYLAVQRALGFDLSELEALAENSLKARFSA